MPWPFVKVKEIEVVENFVLQRIPNTSKIPRFACTRWISVATVDTFWTLETDHQAYQHFLATSSIDRCSMVPTHMCGPNPMTKIEQHLAIRMHPHSFSLYLKTLSDEAENCVVEAVTLEVLPGSANVWSTTGKITETRALGYAICLGITFV